MPIQIQWDDDQHTVLVQIYQGDWTLPEYLDVIGKTYDLIEALDHPVDLIADLRNSGKVPVQLMSAKTYAEHKISSRQRLLVLAGADSFLKTMGIVASRLTPHLTRNLHFVKCVDEARQYIAQYRARNPV